MSGILISKNEGLNFYFLSFLSFWIAFATVSLERACEKKSVNSANLSFL